MCAAPCMITCTSAFHDVAFSGHSIYMLLHTCIHAYYTDHVFTSIMCLTGVKYILFKHLFRTKYCNYGKRGIDGIYTYIRYIQVSQYVAQCFILWNPSADHTTLWPCELYSIVYERDVMMVRHKKGENGCLVL